MPSVFQDLCAVAKTKPKAGESFEVFVKQLTDRIGKVPDAAWQSLSDAAQKWHNDTMTALTDGRSDARAAAKAAGEDEDAAAAAVPLPNLEGYEPVFDELADQQDPPLEEKVDPDTGEVTAAVAEDGGKSPKDKTKPKKADKAVKTAKPKKVDKPTKPVKAAKPAKEKKAKPTKKSDEARGRKGTFELTSVITVLAKENPKRKGSEAEKLFKLYKTGQTVAAALKAGVRWRDLRWDSKSKFISVK